MKLCHLVKGRDWNDSLYPVSLNLQHHFLFSDGILNAITASLVLKQLMYDGYKDDGTVLSGYLFKVI